MKVQGKINEKLLEIYEIPIVYFLERTHTTLCFYLTNKPDGNISNSLGATLE